MGVCCRLLDNDRGERRTAGHHGRSLGQVQEPDKRPDGSVQWRPHGRPPAARRERRGAVKHLV